MNIFEQAAALIMDDFVNESMASDMYKNSIKKKLEQLKTACGYEPKLVPEVMESDNDFQLKVYSNILTDIQQLLEVYTAGGNKFNSAKLSKFLTALRDSRNAQERPGIVTYLDTIFKKLAESKKVSSTTIQEVIKPTENLYVHCFKPEEKMAWQSAAEKAAQDILNIKMVGTATYRKRQRTDVANAFKENCELRNAELKDATNDTYQIVKGNAGSSRPMIIDKKKKLQLTITSTKQQGRDEYGELYKYSLADVFGNGTIEELVEAIKYFFKAEYNNFYDDPTELDDSVRFTHKGDAIVAVAPELFSEKGYVGGLSGTKQLADGTVIHFVNLSEGRTEKGARYGYSKVENSEGENPYYNEFNPNDGELLIVSEDDKMNKSYLNGDVDHIVFEIDAAGAPDKESTSNYTFLGVFSKVTEQARDNGGYMVNYVLESDTLEVSGHSAGEVTTESKKVRNALKLLKENGYLVEFRDASQNLNDDPYDDSEAWNNGNPTYQDSEGVEDRNEKQTVSRKMDNLIKKIDEVCNRFEDYDYFVKRYAYDNIQIRTTDNDKTGGPFIQIECWLSSKSKKFVYNATLGRVSDKIANKYMFGAYGEDTSSEEDLLQWISKVLGHGIINQDY